MNCKPHQMAMLVKPSIVDKCASACLGVPVKVSELQTPANLMQVLREVVEGPIWMLAQPIHCPHRDAACEGIDRLPDACLRPFDAGSQPEAELADTPLQVPHEA